MIVYLLFGWKLSIRKCAPECKTACTPRNALVRERSLDRNNPALNFYPSFYLPVGFNPAPRTWPTNEPRASMRSSTLDHPLEWVRNGERRTRGFMLKGPEGPYQRIRTGGSIPEDPRTGGPYRRIHWKVHTKGSTLKNPQWNRQSVQWIECRSGKYQSSLGKHCESWSLNWKGQPTKRAKKAEPSVCCTRFTKFIATVQGRWRDAWM